MSKKDEEINLEVRNEEIEKLLRVVGLTIKDIMPKGWGFTVLMFDYGHTFVISAEDYTKEQALLELEKDILTWPKYQAVRAFESDLKEDRVQFKFGMDQDLDFMGHPMPKWYLGSSGKRSKKVWVIDMWDTSNFNQNTK